MSKQVLKKEVLVPLELLLQLVGLLQTDGIGSKKTVCSILEDIINNN
jgi:hypothetical protein